MLRRILCADRDPDEPKEAGFMEDPRAKKEPFLGAVLILPMLFLIAASVINLVGIPAKVLR